ncbi:MAG: hypothetical protein NC301_04640 [Bacteroides sp.]|nr:hypothetical protein [Bacteroides sp.]MCM1378493.1 hypothetical protein [Bacteroides sp.]MCM1444794.1 hypothetical protein [Prevotella sp.]
MQKFNAQKLEKVAQVSPIKVLAATAEEGEGGEGEGNVVVTSSTTPLYYTPNSFYVGMSNEWYGAERTTMLAPARGVTKFVPIQPLTNSTWTWTQYVVNEEGNALVEKDFEEKADTLQYQNTPYAQSATFMTLSAKTTAGDSVTYDNPGVGEFLCGRNFNTWTPSIPESQGIFGVSPVPCGLDMTEDGDPYMFLQNYGFDKTKQFGFTNVNANGVPADVTKNFDKADAASVKVNSFVAKIPSPGAYYQLSSIYFLCVAVTTEEAPINVTVYEMDENNKVGENPVGKGSVILAKGKTSGFVNIDLSAVNILGYNTNKPICTDKGLYLEITGMDTDAFNAFAIMVNGNTRIPAADFTEDGYWRKVYPTHGLVMYSMTDKSTNETVLANNPYISAYTVDETASELIIATDLFLFYNINFPQIYDAFTGEDTTVVELPMEAEPAGVFLDGDYDFAQLYDDGMINIEATEDWLEFEVGYDEEYEITIIAVWANSDCPESGEGRTGKIEITGYACDYTITVNQPAGAKGIVEDSISEVAAAGQGAVEYYDLQGRKLSAAPAKGVYIQRNGTIATKVLR